LSRKIVLNPATEVAEVSKADQLGPLCGKPLCIWGKRCVRHKQRRTERVTSDAARKIAHRRRTLFLCGIAMVLHLSGAKKRKRRRGAWPKQDVDTAILPIGAPYLFWLEPHRKKPIANELLEPLWSQLVDKRRFSRDPVCKGLAHADHFDSHQFQFELTSAICMSAN
jgi:hypothetical protein